MPFRGTLLISKNREQREVVITLKNLLGKVWGMRIVRFGAVAAFCTSVQEVILVILAHNGVSSWWANAIGFAISAQISFALSNTLTWQDRNLEWSPKIASIRWLQFNAVAAGTLVANVIVFALASMYLAPLMPSSIRSLLSSYHMLDIPASLLGAVIGGALSFTLNHFVTFRYAEQETTQVTASMLETENRPNLNDIRARVQREGVAFFMPAYNEAANLLVVVPRIISYFLGLDCPFTIIIVNDGSTKDHTYEVAEMLAEMYPRFVMAVHHEQNQGYGGALQTGINTALTTGHGLIGFSDADGQFDIESFGTLVHALDENDAHLSVGYRIDRADSFKRRLMGRGWHWLSSHILGFSTARDVDCGFKVFTRHMLDSVAPELRGGYAAVSPEIIARAIWAGFTLAEAGLTHKPREHGEQTGANLKVVLRSIVQLFLLRRELQKEG